MNVEALRVLDNSKMFADLLAYGRHWRDATELGESVALPDSLGGARHIVWTGMGGSAIGGDVMETVLRHHLRVPFLVNRRDELPAFTNEETLVIAESYSGNTEETLFALAEAQERDARILCVSTDGELIRICREEDLPHIAIPGGMQPRCGFMFLFVPVLVALARLGYYAWEDLAEAHEETAELLDTFIDGLREDGNRALRLAQALHGKVPVLYASSDLKPVVTRWQTQLNENAKTLAHSHVLPEMNHNEIVGWQHPADVLERMHVLFLRDADESERIARRLDMTARLLEEADVADGITTVESRGRSFLARLFSLIVLGDFTSYYLALLNGVDPSPVERIERLKHLLAEMPR